MNLPHILIGEGPKKILFLPGLNDSFADPISSKRQLLKQWEPLLKDYQILIVGRQQPMLKNSQIEDFAEDYKNFILSNYANFEFESLAGISMGGMIAPYLAQKYPKFKRLFIISAVHTVVASSLSRLKHWQNLANTGDFNSLSQETLKLIYGEVPGNGNLRLVVKQPRMPDFSYSIEAILKHNAKAIINSLKLEIEMLIGNKDPLYSEEIILEAKKLFPNLKITIVNDGTHGFIGTLRDACIKAIDK